MAGKLTDDEETLPCPECGNEVRGQGGYLSCECPANAQKNSYQIRVQEVYPDASAVQHPVSGMWYVRRWRQLQQTPRLYRGPGARTEAEAWRDAWDIMNEHAR